jgi:hypothetical protein
MENVIDKYITVSNLLNKKAAVIQTAAEQS